MGKIPLLREHVRNMELVFLLTNSHNVFTLPVPRILFFPVISMKSQELNNKR